MEGDCAARVRICYEGDRSYTIREECDCSPAMVHKSIGIVRIKKQKDVLTRALFRALFTSLVLYASQSTDRG